MAHKIEELPVFQEAVAFCDAVTEIVKGKVLSRNRDLFNQLADATDSVTANMREGFELGSDDQFANFLGYSKASLAEVVERLKRCEKWGYVTAADIQPIEVRSEALGKMLGGFIKYLRRSGFKHRGAYGSRRRRC